MNFSLSPLGDKAIQILFKEPISKKLNTRIRRTSDAIINEKLAGIIEVVPAFLTLTIYYEPVLLSYSKLYRFLVRICEETTEVAQSCKKEILSIPVSYGNRFGEDLARVAMISNLTEDEVISLHSNEEYLVYMIGFLPGFPYLKGLRKEIETPRLSEPRLRVAKGAVGIGGDQTGVYSIESPGGWNIIGQTPLTLFNPEAKPPFLLKAGDFIRFVPITEEEFYKIESNVKNGTYVITRDVTNDEKH